jgi:hypothetical protein
MAGDEVRPGSLKLVSGYSPHRSLRGLIERTLIERIGENDVRYLHGRVFVVHTDAEPEAVRDWLRDVFEDGESAFVVEFERWSGLGDAIDSTWLLRRGH